MKEKIINRLKRNKGQIEGLIRLMEVDAECDKILVQFQATQSALNGAFSTFLEANLSKCLEDGDIEKIKKVLPLLLKQS